MSATIHHMTPRLRLVDASRKAEREGKQLRYVPREGVREVTCDACHQPIVYGICGCTKPAA